MTVAAELSTTTRVERLRERMNLYEHAGQRVPRPSDWSVADMDCSLAERRAHALRMACERMPIDIGSDELVVGLRTLLSPEEGNGNSGSTSLPGFFRDEAEFKNIDQGRSTSHNVPGFGKLIEHGLGELAARCRGNMGAQTDPVRREYLSSFAIACDAAGLLLERYAALADELAERTDDPTRCGELTKIADVCAHLVIGAPRDLHEALQLYWISWSLIVLEVGCLVSMGRLDQVLAPFWPVDPAEQERAQELIDCFIVKCNDQNELWKGTSLINNQIMLSGLTRDGADGTNPVTWAVLSALDRLNMPDPQPAVRLHDDSPADLIDEVCRLWREGRSQIAVYNDDVFVPSLQGAGICADDARDYSIDACQDVMIDGKSDFYLAGALGMADLLMEGMKSTPADGDWEAFLEIYRKLVAEAAASVCSQYSERLRTRPGLPCPLLSVSMDDCIETGLDLANGGLAIRDKGVMLAQPVVMINSLAALRKVVFEEGAATLAEVARACEANWEGHEALQHKMREAPKWGNDDDAADLPGAAMFRFAAEEIWKQRMPDGSRFLSGIHQAHHVAAGNGMGATPDGRNRGQAMSPTLAPANGTEKNGPTAVMRSVTKIDPQIVQWNSSLTMVFDPGSLRGDVGLKKFGFLLRTWLKLRGPQLQINVVSSDMLRAAKADPDQFRDLIVRVWGFCDRFVSLHEVYQDELIERTRHGL
jgi:pyruvate-formate lyase